MHELKNPVTSMISTLQRVLMPSNATKTLSDPKIQALLETASRKGWELNEIIKTVYSIYSEEGATVSEIGIVELTDVVVKFASEYLDTHGVDLEINMGSEDFHVLCSQGGVRQILLNLLKNGAEAMTDAKNKRIRLSIRRDAQFGYFEVHDHGPGIPEEMWEAVLAPRFSTKSANLGIGLSFCAKAAEAFGGFIRIEKSDCGAKICLGIPLAGTQGIKS
jgi:signal transduction histidine kinase